MNKSVNLYLASGVYNEIAFWLVDFTEDDNVINSIDGKLLECYRKELFGLTAAIEVKEAINYTLDILLFHSGIANYKLFNSKKVYSSEIPLNIIEDIFDLWAYNYKDKILWKKYIGLLKFRGKIKKSNIFINKGLKGKTYEFASKLDELFSFKPVDSGFSKYKTNKLMW